MFVCLEAAMLGFWGFFFGWGLVAFKKLFHVI